MTRFLDGHALRLLEGGDAYFAALGEAIAAARDEVHVQAYIFMDDAAGRRIADALLCAAARGVGVHVLIDGFGGRTMASALRERLRGGGVELQFFRPQVSLLEFQRSRLRRLHHKIVAVDGTIAFVGGINLIDDLHTPGHTPPRWDYAVQVRGPLTTEILRVARQVWQAVSRTYRRQRWQPRAVMRAPGAAVRAGDVRAAFVIRGTLHHRRDIEDAYLEAIGQAEREVFIASAYFLPGREIRHALLAAARRGVRVVVLLQARMEYMLMRHASRALYHQLIEAGVEIHEYHLSFMHAKVAVIDRQWATVGSSNIDPLSLLLAREANVFVRDARFAAGLLASLARAMNAGARRVPATGAHRGLVARVASWISYGIVRALISRAGHGARRDYL